MNVFPEPIAKNVDSVRSEFRAWTSSMRAPSEMDEEDAIRNLHENGKHGRQIEDYKEMGARLLQWAKTRTEPIEAQLHGDGMEVGAGDRTD